MSQANGWMAALLGWREQRRRAREERKLERRGAAAGGSGGTASAIPAGLAAVAAAATLALLRDVARFVRRHWAALLVLLLAAWIGSAAMRAVFAASDADLLWVNWGAWRSQIASQAATDAKAGAPHRLAHWDDAMARADGPGWAPADREALMSFGELASANACLREGFCARLSAAWRPSFAALLVGRDIEWRRSALAIAEGVGEPSKQSKMGIETASRARWGSPWSLAGLCGALAALAPVAALCAALSLATSAAGKRAEEEGEFNFAAATRLAVVFEWAKWGGSIAGAVSLVVMGGFAFAAAAMGPRLTIPEHNAGVFMLASHDASAQAATWTQEGAGSSAISFGLSSAKDPGDVPDRVREAAKDACSKAGLCGASKIVGVGEALRFMAMGEMPEAKAAGAQESSSLWGLRRQAAAFSDCWFFAMLISVFSIVVLAGAGIYVLANAEDLGVSVQSRMAGFARTGQPLAERRALLSEAKKGAVVASAERQENGEEKVAARKAPRL
jgi:hypothetical protein